MTIRFNRHTAAYPIGVVKELTDLSERQIRYYEENDLVVPERTEGNQRLYSQADVERLVRIKSLLEGGYTIRKVKEYFENREELEMEIESLTRLREMSASGDLHARFRELRRLPKKRTRQQED